jgi:hypothetical protein
LNAKAIAARLIAAIILMGLIGLAAAVPFFVTEDGQYYYFQFVAVKYAKGSIATTNNITFGYGLGGEPLHYDTSSYLEKLWSMTVGAMSIIIYLVFFYIAGESAPVVLVAVFAKFGNAWATREIYELASLFQPSRYYYGELGPLKLLLCYYLNRGKIFLKFLSVWIAIVVGPIVLHALLTFLWPLCVRMLASCFHFSALLTHSLLSSIIHHASLIALSFLMLAYTVSCCLLRSFAARHRLQAIKHAKTLNFQQVILRKQKQTRKSKDS